MKTPRLVFACNHYVKETFSEALSRQIVRATDIPELPLSDDIGDVWRSTYASRDVIFVSSEELGGGNIVITSSQCKEIELDEEEPDMPAVSMTTQKYRASLDYDIKVRPARAGQYIFIDWIKDRATGTTLPERYEIKIWYDRHFSKQYTEDDCPRCCGDRWYAGLFEGGTVNAEFAEKANRLVQAFFKYIYTRKQEDGFGSTLLASIGKYSTSEENTLRSIISSEIDAFVTYYKNQTSAMMLDGYQFNDDEIINSYYVTNVARNEGEYNVTVRVRFYTMNGNDFSVDIVLPEEN